jgi:hypothetical protein
MEITFAAMAKCLSAPVLWFFFSAPWQAVVNQIVIKIDQNWIKLSMRQTQASK